MLMGLGASVVGIVTGLRGGGGAPGAALGPTGGSGTPLPAAAPMTDATMVPWASQSDKPSPPMT